MTFKIQNIETKKKESNFQLDQLLKKDITFLSSSFNNKKKEAFYTELSVLLNAGIILKDALNLLWEEQKNKKDKDLIKSISDELVFGKSFSDAVNRQKDFSVYEYHSLKIGEATGTLAKVTTELGLFYKRKNEQKKIIMNALSYPIIVLMTAFLSVFFMLKYVVPMFAEIFKQNNVELPGVTKMIISFSNGFQKYFLLIIMLVLVWVVFRKFFQKNVNYQRITSSILLKIPFVGELIRKMYLAQFTQAVSLLTNAKIPVLNSLQMTKKMIPFYPLQVALENTEKAVLQGESLSTALKPHKIFDNKMISLIKVAEETNKNELIFERLTEQYNEDIQYNSKLLSTVLEPIIIILLGSLVAVILIAMYLPMFKLSTVLG